MNLKEDDLTMESTTDNKLESIASNKVKIETGNKSENIFLDKAKIETDKGSPKESVIKYSVEELSNASAVLFGVKPECVRAAFLVAGVERATKEEAKELVKSFMTGEVK